MPKSRDRIQMSEAEIEEFLAGRHSMSVATFNHDGTIHLVAMWYGFIDGKPAFETYAKSQKVLNVRRDPRMTLLVESGDSYEQLRGVELVGTARVLDDEGSTITVARSVVERYWGVDDGDIDTMAAGLAHKRVAVVLDADRVVSWDHAKL